VKRCGRKSEGERVSVRVKGAKGGKRKENREGFGQLGNRAEYGVKERGGDSSIDSKNRERKVVKASGDTVRNEKEKGCDENRESRQSEKWECK